ncbi:MAG: hypothetical protein WCC37_20940 [Candidatus Sulfotelmatobacter sp.]
MALVPQLITRQDTILGIWMILNVKAILQDDRVASGPDWHLAVQADVSTAVGAQQLFTVAEAELGPVDYLVNNAGANSL